MKRLSSSVSLLNNTLAAQVDMFERWERGHVDEGETDSFRAMLNTDCDQLRESVGMLAEALQKFEMSGFTDVQKTNDNRKLLMAAFSLLTKWKRF